MSDDVDVHRPNDDDEDPSRMLTTIQAMAAGFGPGVSPIAEHVSSEHIDKLLENQSKFADLSLEDRKDSRSLVKYVITISVGAVCAVSALLVFSDNSAILSTLLTLLAGLIAGGAGGYGIGSKSGSEG